MEDEQEPLENSLGAQKALLQITGELLLREIETEFAYKIHMHLIQINAKDQGNNFHTTLSLTVNEEIPCTHLESG